MLLCRFFLIFSGVGVGLLVGMLNGVLFGSMLWVLMMVSLFWVSRVLFSFSLEKF